MTFSQAPESGRRTRGLRIAAGIWLLCISLITLVHSVELSRLTGQTRRDTQATQVRALATQVAALTQQTEAGKRQPRPASQADVVTARQALETRLASLEQAQADAVHASDLQALQGRVSALENRPQALHSAPAVRRPHLPPVAKPKVLAPPFRIVGVERRGGVRFLSIALPTTTSLANVSLLREGDSDSGWQLQSIEAHAALFRVNGQPQRVALPQDGRP